MPPHALGRERARPKAATPGAPRHLGGVRGEETVDRQTEDEFVTVVDDQTDDVALHDHPDSMVAVQVRPGLILTPKLAALITRAYHDSKNPGIVCPHNKDEHPPDAHAC